MHGPPHDRAGYKYEITHASPETGLDRFNIN
jgi:hypothetical protein